MLKKVWTDPVWSKVIATAIVAAVAAAAAYFAGWLPDIVSLGSSVVSFAVSSTAIPNWLLGVLVLCALAVFTLAGIGLWTTFSPGVSASSYRSYTEDVILGIKWRWSYGSSGATYHLVSFCPHCDYQIHPHETGAYSAVGHVEYRCEDCGTPVGSFMMGFPEIESRVTRHIHKNLRTGKWAEVVNAQQRAAADAPQAARR